jgi:ABC-type multidrug transport system fused ATPase/permease subunit
VANDPRSSAYRGLGRFVRPQWLPLAAATGLVVLQTVLELAAPWPLKVAVDHAIGGQPLPRWLAFLGPFSPYTLAVAAAAAGVALVVLGGGIRYAGTYLSGAAAERIGADLRAAVFEHLLRLSLRFHDRHRSGDLVSRILSDVPRVQDALVALFHSLIPDALSLMGMLAVLLAIDGGLALAALGVVPLLALQIWLSRARIRAAERDARDRHGGLAARATEVLRHVRAVQAFAREDDESRRFRTDIAAATRASVTALAVHARYSPFADVILALGGGLILVLGVAKVLSGELTVGVLLVVLTYVSSLYDPIRSLTRLSSVLARAAASGERLQEILSAQEIVTDSPSAGSTPEGACSLSLDRVAFGYQSEVPVLRDLSLEIAAGETLCIVGPTGAGKSTLLSLLLRLYDPVEGTVRMGGRDLRALTLRSLRGKVAVVPQDAWILDGTIADNIRFGNSIASDQEVRTAGRTALVHEFASRLPDGYDTVVGESGCRLSGGQRRRIALARALLRDARVLLLDEPTSGLDAESEATVMRSLRRVAAGRTVVMVSHRLGLAAMADRVVVMRQGRVVEDGPPRQLLDADGAFARLWAEQGLAGFDPASKAWTAGPVVGPVASADHG